MDIKINELCGKINNLDIVNNKEEFIKNYNEVNEKIIEVDNYLKSEINVNEKTLKEIIDELMDMDISEINNDINIEKIKYYNDLLNLYDKLMSESGYVINYV